MTEPSNEAPTRREPEPAEATPPEIVHEILRAELYYHQGALPAPETLQRYDEVLPGLANRIVTRMEREGEHRHSIER